MKSALTIAGFDPSGGAGIQADLKVFRALDIYGLSVAAALTAQNSKGVSAVRAVEPSFVQRQLTVLFQDMKPDALKTGMLYSKANVEVVVKVINRYGLRNIVVDPVLLSSSGRLLAEKGVEKVIRKKLLPLAEVITPNIHEASVLARMEIRTLDDMKRAAVILHDLGAANVVITGGHLEKGPVDIIYNGMFTFLKGRKISGEFHGTGCRFSAVIAARLADGCSVVEAVRQAKTYVRQSMRQTFSTGKGMRLFNV